MKPAPAGILVLAILMSAPTSGCSRSSPSPQRWSEQPSIEQLPCGTRSSDEVERIFANPRTFAHRIVTIPGQYLSGFEISALHTCANGHFVLLWVEDASEILYFAKLNDLLPLQEHGYNPILEFKFDEQKNTVAWGKLKSQGYCSDVTLVGQLETTTPETGGFGHLSAYHHELILLDVLSTKACGLHP